MFRMYYRIFRKMQLPLLNIVAEYQLFTALIYFF